MKLENATPFEVLWIPGRLRYPAHSLTSIVKGTFDLARDARAAIAETQDPILPDVNTPEGESVYYESDFAHFKPRADRLLVGRCHAPGGRAVQETRVAFSVGAWRRELRVIGDREWNRNVLKVSASDPKPFTSMDLVYERAFGGPRFAPNRSGRGYYRDKPESDAERLLPNIEDPAQPVRTPSDAVAPAGFGPLSRTWAPRRNMIGSYGKAWFRTRCPWFPEDIDWGVNNAAPAPNQSAYLGGDESYVLENLRPDAARFAGTLPGLRVRVFVDRRANGADAFEEVEMRLDTLWIDAELGKLALVWRGSCPVASEEFEDLGALYVISEDVAAPKQAKEQVRERFVLDAPAEGDDRAPEPAAATDGGDGASGELPVEATPEASASAPAAGAPGAASEDPEGEEDGGEPAPPWTDTLREQDAMLATMTDSEEVREAREAIREALVILESPPARNAEEPPAPPLPPWTRERVIEAIEGAVPLAEEDLSGLDLTGIDFRAADLHGARLERTILAGAVLAGCNLSGADLAGARLSGAVLAGCDARSATLRDADLSGVDGSGIDFRQAILAGAKGKGARLTKARLDEADLTSAAFQESWLDGASFESASARGIDLTSCDLRGSSFAGADLAQAVIHAVRGEGSVWTGATMDGARVTESDLDEADFTKTSLSSVDFRGSSLRRAVFRRARIEGARMSQADFFEALLPAALIIDSDLRDSNFYGADLADVEARNVQFGGAILLQTRWERD